MPYGFRKVSGNRVAVVNKDTGKVMARHTTRAKAHAQVRAIYANEKREGKKL